MQRLARVDVRNTAGASLLFGLLGLGAVALIASTSCAERDGVAVVSSRLVYHAGGPIGFGSGNPFSVEVHLKTDRPSKRVTVTFIADGVRLETKSVEVLTGLSDSFKVASRDRKFTHGEDRRVEVMIEWEEGSHSGPHTLSVPEPQSDF